MKDKVVIGSSRFGFTKGKFCASVILIAFSESAVLVDEGRAVDVVYLDFSKAFDMVSLSIPIEKVGRYKLDKKTARLVEN